MKLNEDPEVEARIAQYEMAYRMQTSVPDAMDISDEPEEVFKMYGPDSKDPGTYAANCILARKLIEKDVKFVQLYHQGWDHHGGLPAGITKECRNTDQPTAALIKDLKKKRPAGRYVSYLGWRIWENGLFTGEIVNE